MYTLSLLFVTMALSAAIGAMVTMIVLGAQWRAYVDAMRSADDERYEAQKQRLYHAWDDLTQAHRDLAQACAERDAYARNLADAQDDVAQEVAHVEWMAQLAQAQTTQEVAQ